MRDLVSIEPAKHRVFLVRRAHFQNSDEVMIMPRSLRQFSVLNLSSLRLFSIWLTTLALLFGCTVRAQEDHWLTGYLAIYDLNGTMTPAQVDMTKLTHVIYWGVEPTSSGGVNTTKYVSAATFASGATGVVTQAHAAGAKALIGIGGDAYDGYSLAFNEATTPANLPTFVGNIVALMQEDGGFDGVDINWEQIGYYPGDNTQFPAFIAALRTALNALTPKPLLTMSPETQANGGRPDLIGPINQDFDQINLQTYLMSGPYCGAETWHNSPYSNGGLDYILDPTEALPSVTGAVAAYTGDGIPIAKLGMGIQFGGLTWLGGTGTSTGGATKPEQTWTNDNSPAYCSATNPSAPTLGYPLYTQIAPLATAAPGNGYTLTQDTTVDQAWLSYDPSGTGTTNEAKDEFISYDNPSSIAKKGQDLSAGAGLGGTMGGVMLFELSGDYFPSAATGQQHPLLTAANSMQSLLPGAVTGLIITPGTGNAALKWNAAPFATQYKVYYSTTSGSAGTLGATVTTTSTTILNLTEGDEYYFQVQPFNSFGEATGGVATGNATISGLETPTVTWATPASVPYGTVLTATQLNATASVPGNFVYSPAAGTLPAVGTDTLSVTFTPTSASYSKVTKMVSLVVTAATLSTSDNFGSVNAGSTSLAHTISATFIGDDGVSAEVMTMGVSGLDFKAVSAISCSHSGDIVLQTTCTIDVDFTPMAVGQRLGAVLFNVVNTLEKTNTYGSVYLSGTGIAPFVAFDPGGPFTINIPSQISPYGTAIDGAGNIYFANYDAKDILKVPPFGTSSTYVSGLSGAPTALALDGAGNLYVAQNTSVLLVNPAGTVTTFASGLVDPKGIAVDANGNVYIANTNVNSVLRYSPTGEQSTVLTSTAVIAGKKLSFPTGLAVDASGNVYVSDSGNNRILEVPPSGTPTVLNATGLNTPFGIGIGPTGNLFIADENNNRIVRLTPGGVQTTLLSGSVLDINLSSPIAVSTDSYENLYVSDFGNGRLLEVGRLFGGTLNFASTEVGSTSSPQTVTLNNIGNATLDFTVPSSGTNPSVPTGFKLASGTTCPNQTTASTIGTLAGGSSCNYAVSFAPPGAGITYGSLSITDNSGKQMFDLQRLLDAAHARGQLCRRRHRHQHRLHRHWHRHPGYRQGDACHQLACAGARDHGHLHAELHATGCNRNVRHGVRDWHVCVHTASGDAAQFGHLHTGNLFHASRHDRLQHGNRLCLLRGGKDRPDPLHVGELRKPEHWHQLYGPHHHPHDLTRRLVEYRHPGAGAHPGRKRPGHGLPERRRRNLRRGTVYERRKMRCERDLHSHSGRHAAGRGGADGYQRERRGDRLSQRHRGGPADRLRSGHREPDIDSASDLAVRSHSRWRRERLFRRPDPGGRLQGDAGGRLLDLRERLDAGARRPDGRRGGQPVRHANHQRPRSDPQRRANQVPRHIPKSQGPRGR